MLETDLKRHLAAVEFDPGATGEDTLCSTSHHNSLQPPSGNSHYHDYQGSGQGYEPYGPPTLY
jgi:hypothetical protein